MNDKENKWKTRKMLVKCKNPNGKQLYIKSGNAAKPMEITRKTREKQY